MTWHTTQPHWTRFSSRFRSRWVFHVKINAIPDEYGNNSSNFEATFKNLSLKSTILVPNLLIFGNNLLWVIGLSLWLSEQRKNSVYFGNEIGKLISINSLISEIHNRNLMFALNKNIFCLLLDRLYWNFIQKCVFVFFFLLVL